MLKLVYIMLTAILVGMGSVEQPEKENVEELFRPFVGEITSNNPTTGCITLDQCGSGVIVFGRSNGSNPSVGDAVIITYIGDPSGCNGRRLVSWSYTSPCE